MLRGCVDMQLPCKLLDPLSRPGHSDVPLFTLFGIHQILDVSEF